MKQKAGRVSAIFCFKEKGRPGEQMERAHFLAGKGMEGDRHADGGEKQLTLLASEVRQWMKEQEQPGLCFRRYKANLETEGLETELLAPGMKLDIGTASFEVTSCVKACFPECSLWQEGRTCRLSSGGICLKVTEDGTVSIGDVITAVTSGTQ